jgi:hypothetical protein
MAKSSGACDARNGANRPLASPRLVDAPPACQSSRMTSTNYHRLQNLHGDKIDAGIYNHGMPSLPETAANVPRPIKLRSAVTNDPYRLPGVSMRGLLGRRFRDLVSDIAAELGGVDRLGVIDLALVRSAAMDLMRQEEMSAALMRGELVAHEELTRASNSARSALTKLRNKRQPRDTTPTLAEYLAANHGGEAAA